MKKFQINLKNCYGIQSLEHEFDFNPAGKKAQAYAIYAPNGLMKTSLAKTFENISNGELPKEERYNRASTCVLLADGVPVQKERIYVLKSEIDLSEESTAVTNILVQPAHKERYDQLLNELSVSKSKVLSALQKSSKVKKLVVEQTILDDWKETDFAACIEKILKQEVQDGFVAYEHATIFDPKVVEILKSPEFIENSANFNKRYQELFDQAGTIYKKGVFNPAKADNSFGALEKNGFFSGGHKVHLNGEIVSITKAELDAKLQVINASIDGDETLKKLKEQLAKNAQTQALTDLIENLELSQVEALLDKLKPENSTQFRKDLWVGYLSGNADAQAFLDLHAGGKEEIDQIEQAAALAAPLWTQAIDLFNDRFVDMPFALSVANQTKAALGQEKAKLLFTFRDGADTVSWSRQEIKTLSQGEKRALYLLNFIFEVEARKVDKAETLFIIDDIADSFDYKNKHAIIQYLDDITGSPNFRQIILTHNFDFFRTLANNFVHRERCLMANRGNASISFEKAEGIKNYFIGVWKDKVHSNDRILCASIPFTRNLIEYTKGEKDADYQRLTSLLHWKDDTDLITVGNYMNIYNNIFGTAHPTNNAQTIRDLVFKESDAIAAQTTHDGLNLEDKVLLSIGIRLRAEIFLTKELRILKNDPNYWCAEMNQFGHLVKEYLALVGNTTSTRTLEKISITVSSNIHLNSFMYEPILDLTIDHLIKLYNEVLNLEPGSQPLN